MHHFVFFIFILLAFILHNNKYINQILLKCILSNYSSENYMESQYICKLVQNMLPLTYIEILDQTQTISRIEAIFTSIFNQLSIGATPTISWPLAEHISQFDFQLGTYVLLKKSVLSNPTHYRHLSMKASTSHFGITIISKID